MRTLASILLLVLLPFVSECTQPSSTAPGKSGTSKGKSAASSSSLTSQGASKTGTDVSSSTTLDSSSDSSASSTPAAPTTVDPDTAAGSIDPNIAMAPSDLISDANIVFPSITLKKTTADYFQVIRCAASYDMVTLQGASIRSSAKKFSMDDLKWAWGQALNDHRNCKIVAQYISLSPYIDLPAPSGAFYYVANPCVTAANSSTGQDGCSYALTFTKPTLDYENAFIGQLRDLSTQMATAQAVLNADLDDVRITAKKFEIALNLCEEYYAFKETEKSLQRGLIMLALNLVGAVVGFAVVGVQGAMMVGMLAQMMGGNVINGILGLNPAVSSCLAGEGIAGQQGLTKQEDIKRARDSAQFFESSYHVKQTLDHLIHLIQAPSQENPVGGKLAQDVAAVQKIMAKMNAIDQKIISVDAQIGKANAYIKDQMTKLDSGSTDTKAVSP